MFSGGGGVRQVCDDGPAGGGGPAHAGTSTESERDAMKSFVEFRGVVLLSSKWVLSGLPQPVDAF